jgi:hypothetical protein
VAVEQRTLPELGDRDGDVGGADCPAKPVAGQLGDIGDRVAPVGMREHDRRERL